MAFVSIGQKYGFESAEDYFSKEAPVREPFKLFQNFVVNFNLPLNDSVPSEAFSDSLLGAGEQLRN